MLPLMAAVVALAALSGVSVMMLDKAEDYGFLTAVFVATLMAFFVCIFAVCVMAFVVMIQRFYNNLLGSEGVYDVHPAGQRGRAGVRQKAHRLLRVVSRDRRGLRAGYDSADDRQVRTSPSRARSCAMSCRA